MSPVISTATQAQKIANVQALRFQTRGAVERLIGRNGFISGGEVAQDDRGFYVGGTFTLHPAIAALPTQAEVDAHNAANPTPVVERAAPARNIKNGACDRVRAWARANPEGTKEEALAALPDINPATVKIQLRKVRLGQV